MYFLPEGTSTDLNSGKSLGASSADTEGRIIHSRMVKIETVELSNLMTCF